MSVTAQNPGTQHIPNPRLGTPGTPGTPGTTVPREYVHKAAESEVLLTGWSPLGGDRHRVTARWPVDHPFYAPVGGFHDPMLLAESIRQAGALLSHLAYGVPFGHRQSWARFRYSVDPAALAVTDSPAHVEMHITCTDVLRRAGRLSSMSMHAECYLDGALLGTADITFCDISPAVYRRLRGPHADLAESNRRALPLTPPLTPGRVARSRFDDVVLSETNSPQRSQLRVDLAHPVLFDHAVDHVPGMLLLEAARQASHATAHPHSVIPTAMDTVFSQYVELDAPCWIHATSPAPTPATSGEPICVEAVQNDRSAFRALVTTTPLPA